MVTSQRRSPSAPWIIGGIYLGLAVIMAGVALLSDLPLEFEGGPLSFLDAFLLFVLAGLLLVTSAHAEWRTPIRSGYLLAMVLALGIGIIQLVGLLDGETPLVEELDVGNMLCWLIAGGFLIWMLRAARPVRSAEKFLILGFVLQSFSLFADVTDGMFIELPDLFDWLFGPGEEISEVLFLGTYCCGFALLASQSMAESLRWAPASADEAEFEEPAQIIKRAHMALRWQSSTAGERVWSSIRFAAVPVGFCAEWLYHALRSGSRVQASSGKDRLQQSIEAFHARIAAGVPAVNYYKFDLFLDRNRQHARHYLHRHEFKGPAGINRLIKRLDRTIPRQASLFDKVVFADHCAGNGLPTTPVLAHGIDGRLTRAPQDGTLPPIDLFAKPNRGKGGQGAARWCWTGSTWRREDGLELDAAGLLAHIAQSQSRGGLLLQPRRVNHVALADLAGPVLATVRVLTCLNENRQPEATHAVLRMPNAADATVDNFHAGGIAAAVDLRSGRLGRATDLGLNDSVGWVERHPLTGAVIAGRQLPLWRETIELAVQAHRSFSNRAVIGWDIGILAHGVELIEGNGSPDFDILQRTHARPIGLDRLGELLLFNLRYAAAMAERARQGRSHGSFPVA